MGFRFFRRIKVLPGLTINLTKRGISASLGVRGAKITTGTSGTRATVGVPGTGLFYTKKLKHWSDPPIGEPDSPGSSRPPTPPTAADAGQASPSTGSEWVPAEPQDTSGFTDENRTVNPDEPEGRRAVGLSPHSKGILDGIAKDLVSLESALGDPTFTAPRLGG